jgi:surface polysaccharide O-acyltransferase-like enzyme
MTLSQRFISADLLKTISIIGVVFIHGATTFGCDSEFTKVMQDLFRFAVPCFFMIWAFFFEKSYAKKNKEERKKYIRSRFIHNFIVYFVWSLIYFFILVDWSSLTLTKIFTTHFLGYGWAGQYFLIILLQLMVLFPLLRYCYSVKFFRWAIVVLTGFLYIFFEYYKVPEFIQKLGLSPFIYWVIYVFVGIALARGKIVRIPKFFGLLVFLIPIEFFILGESASPYIIPSVLVGSIALCIVTLQRSINIENKYSLTIVSMVGGGTMSIFVVNPLVIMFLKDIVCIPRLENCNGFLNILMPFISVFCIILFCFGIAEIIKFLKIDKIVY